jgi:hypothetical protein
LHIHVIKMQVHRRSSSLLTIFTTPNTTTSPQFTIGKTHKNPIKYHLCHSNFFPAENPKIW